MFQIYIHAYRSSKGNSQFTMLPFRVPRIDVCSYFDKPYRQYIMKSMKPPASDMPYSEDPKESLCKMFKARENVGLL